MNDNWQPPPWLLCHYIAMNANGAWHGFAFCPIKTRDGWVCDICNSINLSERFVDFTPPPCDDWTTSSRRLRAAT